jgi:hypothetical protein
MTRVQVSLVVLAGALALGFIGLTWAVGVGSSEAPEGAMQDCPLPGNWAVSVWVGDDGTPTEQAMATCTEATVAAAYWIDPQTQVWKRYFDGRPDLTSLSTLDNMQGVLALGEEAADTSGIEGQVLLGPMCPVVQIGSPCPGQPFQATIIVWNAERTTEIRSVTTDQEGRFHVPLVPGDYYLAPQPVEPDQPFPVPIPQNVTVPPNQFVQITVEYDTGIR